jgi:sugar lactone lactonase YvrE/DNA-directed RNA polymerase subunit RPC12/RpoP
MTDSTTPGTFNCPHCGAPLEPEKGVRSMQCRYCNTTVIIPKELRTRLQQAPLVPVTSPGFGKGCGRVGLIVGVIGLVAVIGLAIGLTALVKNLTKDIPGVSSITSGFASPVLTFGSEGIGQGMFSDARSVAVEANGNILVGDYEDGRVQTFNSSGKYLSTFSVGSSGVDALAVSPDGMLYIIHDRGVSIYDPNGQELGQVPGADGADSLAFGQDGSLYILTDEDVVKHFDTSGNLTLTIHGAFASVLGRTESTQSIAVDGIGNIYIIGDSSCTALKYSPTGQYLDQFSGEAASSGPAIPGTVFNPSGIGVDGYGRIFISDWNSDVQVFDSNDTPLQSIDVLTLGFTSNPFGMALDNKGKLYLALGDKIMVLKIQAPQQ